MCSECVSEESVRVCSGTPGQALDEYLQSHDGRHLSIIGEVVRVSWPSWPPEAAILTAGWKIHNSRPHSSPAAVTDNGFPECSQGGSEGKGIRRATGLV